MAGELLYSAKSDRDIVRWAKQYYFGGAIPKQLENDGKRYLVILGDNASGVMRVTVLLYVLENNEWKLCLVRFTSNIDVHPEIDKKNNNLIFKSREGTIILIQPLNSLKYEFAAP